MLKRLLTAAIFSLSCCVCHAQTPNAVPMRLEPLPETNWYINISGFYGHEDYETNTFVKDSVRLINSYFVGMEGDETAERGIAWNYSWGGSNYQIEVVTDLATTQRYKMDFPLMSANSEAYDEDDEWAKNARSFEAYAIVQGQPIGFRFFSNREKDPFKEVMYEDPGEPPKLWMVETVFVPTGDSDNVYNQPFEDEDEIEHEYEEYDDSAIYALNTSLIEFDGEGYEGGITPHTVTDISTDITYDGGVTWKSWRFGGFGRGIFPPESLAQNPHPIIKVTAYHRMRRYVKYYTYKKGFSDAPGGPYEPITMEELQEQENRKKLEDTEDSLKSVEDGGTEDTTDHVKTIADESIAETTGERSK